MPLPSLVGAFLVPFVCLLLLSVIVCHLPFIAFPYSFPLAFTHLSLVSLLPLLVAFLYATLA